MDAFDFGGCNDQVPRRRETLFIAQFLPKLDIEVAFGIFAADQAAHDQSIGHYLYYPPFSSAASSVRPAPMLAANMPITSATSRNQSPAAASDIPAKTLKVVRQTGSSMPWH